MSMTVEDVERKVYQEVHRNEVLERYQIARRQRLHRLLTSYEGREVIWNVLEGCNCFAASFAGESTHHTAFNEGKRDAGIQLLREIAIVSTVEFPFYSMMQMEAASRDAEVDKEINNGTG